MQRQVPRAGLLVGVLALAACSSGSGSATVTVPVTAATTTSTTPAPSTLPPLADDPELAAELDAITSSTTCDALDPRSCLLPYPSNFFTATDPASDTQLRVTFAEGAMPTNASGTSVDPSEWNRNDGFSPNSSIITFVANLDPEATKLPSWTDVGAALDPASTVVLVDMATLALVPLWAEPDAKAAEDADRALIIHPAVPLAEGHRYAVALQGMVTHDGTSVEPSPAFRAFRDRIVGPEWIESRRETMENTLKVLTLAGVDRDGLQLAWDFTVASTRSLAERMIGIRDATLNALGERAPDFEIAATDIGPDEDGLIARKVTGTFTVPNFLTGEGAPGESFFYGTGGLNRPDEIPQQNGTLEAGFVCIVPTSATDGSAAGPTHLALYGHGLLGSDDEVMAGNVRRMADEHNVLFCATKWAGLSEDDIPNAIEALGDFSNFFTVADRLQQGVLNAILLGRLMLHPDGLTSDVAFSGVTPDLTQLDYDGNSQGGIMGLMLTAVSPDIDRAVLGVPGMNYSLLLPRSIDFDDYESVMKPAYPDDLDRTILIALIQMLWDRGEGAGYVQHVTTNPYPGTPAKDVLLQVAFGDHQVSELTALIEARALGARYHEPLAAPGRLRSDTVAFGLAPIDSYPYPRSALVMWDSGATPIPLEQLAPRDGEDPHGDPRSSVDARQQKAAFLFDDQLIDVCGGGPCTAEPS